MTTEDTCSSNCSSPLLLASQAHPAAQGSAERRAVVRHACPLYATCWILTEGSTAARFVQVENLSAAGVALRNDRVPLLGTILVITLESRVVEALLPRLVRVRHVQPAGEGAWVIGCTFSVRLNEGELVGYLDQVKVQ